MPAETVTAQPRGLQLFGAGTRKIPLSVTGKRAQALEKLGIASVQDLLQHYPRRTVDRRDLRTVADIKRSATEQDLGEVQIHAKVVKLSRPIAIGRPNPKTRKRKAMIRAQIGDETGSLDVTWFNQDWVLRVLSEGSEAFFYGRLSSFRGKLQLNAPRFELLKTGKEPFNVGRIVPIYAATSELSTDQIRRLIWDSLRSIDEIADPVPEEIRKRFRLLRRHDALRLIHFPEEKDDVIRARKRLVFDELFTLQLGLVYRKRKLERTVRGVQHDAPGADSLAEVFVDALPFELTSAQRVACDEVAGDMVKTYPMHRLLEGEVGSGKTVVALYGCLVAIESGHQAAFMAPTEVLAEQHHLTVKELLGRAFGEDEATNLFAGISKRPVVRLLTGSTSATERAKTLAAVASGEVDLLIGTHALIQDAIAFKDLGLAVVDEQHRFGVHQRKALREKGAGGEPDVLVMTATPIPRTLAVTIYGDLDISILDELPKGRRAVKTSIAVGDEGRDRVYDLIRAEVNAGRQAFIVYALRDESDKVELRSAKSESKRLAQDVFPDLHVGLVHGDMKADEKEEAMTSFRDGKTDVLVATTVIEVGVDVPNATVMLVESAERFGLAQLHQLRGRIGRGQHASYCILATDLDLDAAGDDAAVAVAAERLHAVTNTTDGFKLAMTDLRQRGEGELFGARQSGMPQLKMARVLEHEDMIKAARDVAVQILDVDPELGAYEHIALEREMRDRFPDRALDVVQSG